MLTLMLTKLPPIVKTEFKRGHYFIFFPRKGSVSLVLTAV